MNKIIQSSRHKLSLYGLSPKQIQLIENNDIFSNTLTIVSTESGVITSIDTREGEYVMEGGSIYHIADYSVLWAEAEVYSASVAGINNNMTATVYVPGIPNFEHQEKSPLSILN